MLNCRFIRNGWKSIAKHSVFSFNACRGISPEKGRVHPGVMFPSQPIGAGADKHLLLLKSRDVRADFSSWAVSQFPRIQGDIFDCLVSLKTKTYLEYDDMKPRTMMKLQRLICFTHLKDQCVKFNGI